MLKRNAGAVAANETLKAGWDYFAKKYDDTAVRRLMGGVNVKTHTRRTLNSRRTLSTH